MDAGTPAFCRNGSSALLPKPVFHRGRALKNGLLRLACVPDVYAAAPPPPPAPPPPLVFLVNAGIANGLGFTKTPLPYVGGDGRATWPGPVSSHEPYMPVWPMGEVTLLLGDCERGGVTAVGGGGGGGGGESKNREGDSSCSVRVVVCKL